MEEPAVSASVSGYAWILLHEIKKMLTSHAIGIVKLVFLKCRMEALLFLYVFFCPPLIFLLSWRVQSLIVNQQSVTVFKINWRLMCVHAHPDSPLASRKMRDLYSICVTSVSLGTSMDLNIINLYACPNRWSFSNWPRLWLEGSLGGVGKLDRRWRASDRGWEGEGETVLLLTILWFYDQGRAAPFGSLSARPGCPNLPQSWAPPVVGAFPQWEKALGMVTPLTCLRELELGTHLQDVWVGLFWEFIMWWHCCPEQQTSGACHPVWMNSFYCHWPSWIPGT